MAPSHQQKSSPLDALPEELLSMIIDNHLLIADIIALSQTNHNFHRLSDWRHYTRRQELLAFLVTRQFCEWCYLRCVPGSSYHPNKGAALGWVRCARCGRWTKRIEQISLEFACDDDLLGLCSLRWRRSPCSDIEIFNATMKSANNRLACDDEM